MNNELDIFDENELDSRNELYQIDDEGQPSTTPPLLNEDLIDPGLNIIEGNLDIIPRPIDDDDPCIPPRKGIECEGYPTTFPPESEKDILV